MVQVLGRRVWRYGVLNSVGVSGVSEEVCGGGVADRFKYEA